MAKFSHSQREPSLLIARSKAFARIQAQIAKGESIARIYSIPKGSIPKDTNSTLIYSYKFYSDAHTWREENLALLSSIFSSQKLAQSYSRLSFAASVNSYTGFLVNDILNDFRGDMAWHLDWLATLLDRLDFIPEPHVYKYDGEDNQSQSLSKVFLVHGRNKDARKTVESYLKVDLDLDVVALDEKPNESLTIIEKLEKYSAHVGYAVVLVTPDDIGYLNDGVASARLRARQNVVLELGYFAGKLGRQNVCIVLNDSNASLEMPSDFQGVLWVKMDDTDNWRDELRRELSFAGLIQQT